jgi:hypothetical protein
MRKTLLNTSIVAIIFALLSIDAFAKDLDIKKIAGINLGDEYGTILIWMNNNNLKFEKEFHFSGDGVKSYCISIDSLPANDYHFKKLLMFFNTSNRMYEFQITIDSNYFDQLEHFEKLMNTLLWESNSFKDYENINMGEIYYDNCTINIFNNLGTKYPSFEISFRKPSKQKSRH